MNIGIKAEALIFAVLAFVATYLLVPLTIRFCHKFNILDIPNVRKVHSTPVPVGGGLAFFVPIFVGILAYRFLHKGLYFSEQFLQIAIGSGLITLLGIFDDKYHLRAYIKLLGQILIVLIVYLGGVRITEISSFTGKLISLDYLSIPFTLIWFIVVINAFNLIDGLDGFASGIAVLVSASLLVAGFMFYNPIIIIIASLIIGSNLAFLHFNFYPARIFMGDTGSMLLGFLIAAISISGSGSVKGVTTMTLFIPITALLLPFLDTMLSVIRRLRYKQNIFRADKHHIHHKLLSIGLSQRAAAFWGYGVTALFGAIALLSIFLSIFHYFLIIFLLVIIIIISLIYLLKRKRRRMQK